MYDANEEGNLEQVVVELLLANKADINAKTNGGETPFQKATLRGQNAIVELLRKYGGYEYSPLFAQNPATNRQEII